MAATKKTVTNGRQSLNGSAGDPKPIKLLDLDIRELQVAIRGSATLISNRMSEESIDDMRKKQEGEAKLPKAPKDPEKCFRGSCHLMPGSAWTDKSPRFGFPAIAFKSAMVEAANDMGMTMTEAKRLFQVAADDGGLVELRFKELRHRIDPAPNKNGVLDIRHRGEFVGWSCVLTIKYNASTISAEQVVNLLNAAGFGVGVGAWRPKGKKSTGTHGTFEVVTTKK